MRQLTLSIFLFGILQTSTGQKPMTLQDSVFLFFKDVQTAAKENYSLWDKDIYGPILLVDPSTYKVFANETDSAMTLKPSGKIFTGTLPEDVNIANTSVNWNGKSWAMIRFPLPDERHDRINLMAHELFHRAQASLHFKAYNPQNNQLDEKDGRITLRLELNALKKAVQAKSASEVKQHISDALTFRKYRHSLYPGSDSTENLLELNEGIAEFTGEMMSGRNEEETAEHFINSIDAFLSNATFVRSFAYQTIPVYGYLLSKMDNGWNKKINTTTNLADFFIRDFKVSIPTDLENAVKEIAENYNGKKISAEENTREEKRQKLIAGYKKQFIEQPHFDIDLDQDMRISFDPRNLMPLEDKGTVYPTARITDNWGILTVENGALMSPRWDRITVSNPEKTDENKITGDGWTLNLEEGYTLEQSQTSGNFMIIKK